MKEVTTVEIDRSEIEDSIKDYLFKNGYEAKSIYFKTGQLLGLTNLSGARIEVTKIQNNSQKGEM